jgi:uncharacterized circularly permuted ATP-grasp superfamily protein/uncharacterized alpha-E superfamily protein
LLDTYRPLADAYDEAFAAPGVPRPHAAAFYREFAARERRDLDEHVSQIQAQLAEFGLDYRAPGEERDDRPGALDVLPAFLSSEEFAELARGVAQRAKVIELAFGDLTGKQELLASGAIPAELVFNNPRFQRAAVQGQEEGRKRLSLYAVDLVRTESGTWRAIADYTGLPPDLGFALEHRMIVSRLYPRAFQLLGAERLAGFFMTLRAALRAAAPVSRDNPRIVFLTQGAGSRGYFEDAYLARYLGFPLAEAADLAVRESKLFLKTLGGPLPVHAVLRGLFDDDCDPVELKGGSDGSAGVAGLLEAIRAGSTALANPVGSGLMETPVFAAFYDRLCERLLGESLLLPSLPTWWTGEPEAQSIVAERLRELEGYKTFAIPNTAPILLVQAPYHTWTEARRQWEENPGGWFFREPPTRSTSPVWNGNSLEPWSLQIRMYATADGDGFSVMPGAVAKLTPPPGSRAGQRVRVQDVWALSDRPVENVSLLQEPGTPIEIKRSGAELPSRVAEDLFWLGRWLERTENKARLLRALVYRLSGESDVAGSPAIRVLARSAAAVGLIEASYGVASFEAALPRLDGFVATRAIRSNEPDSLISGVKQCLRSASRVRDRLSTDFWQILHRMQRHLHQGASQDNDFLTDELTSLNRLIFDFHAASGAMHESGTRTLGWSFLEIGRRIERTTHTATLLENMLSGGLSEEGPSLEATLEAGDSIMTYRSRYLGQLQPHAVLDLLLLDGSNPRGVAFQLEALQRQVDLLERATGPQAAPKRIAASAVEAIRAIALDDLLRATDPRHERLLNALETIKGLVDELGTVITEIYLLHVGPLRRFGNFSRDD